MSDSLLEITNKLKNLEVRDYNKELAKIMIFWRRKSNLLKLRNVHKYMTEKNEIQLYDNV